MERDNREMVELESDSGFGIKWIREVDPKPFMKKVETEQVSRTLSMIRGLDKGCRGLLLVQEQHTAGNRSFVISKLNDEADPGQSIISVRIKQVADVCSRDDFLFLAVIDEVAEWLEVYYKNLLLRRIGTVFKSLVREGSLHSRCFVTSNNFVYWKTDPFWIFFVPSRPFDDLDKGIFINNQIQQFAVNRFNDYICVVDWRSGMQLFGADRKLLESERSVIEPGVTAKCLTFIKLDWIMLCLHSNKHQSTKSGSSKQKA